MKKMQLQLKSSGGRRLAAETIETIFISGEDHLIDRDYYRKAKSASIVKNCLFLILMIAFFATFTWLAIDKINREMN